MKLTDYADKYQHLSYGQTVLLTQLPTSEFSEASEACKKADCSWDEMYKLNGLGMIHIQTDNINKRVLIKTDSETQRIAKEILEHLP